MPKIFENIFGGYGGVKRLDKDQDATGIRGKVHSIVAAMHQVLDWRKGWQPASGRTQKFGMTKSSAVLALAIHHFEVALALRPKSGIAWAMLGMVRAARIETSKSPREDIRLAVQTIGRSTEVSPDSALCWCLKGIFFGMTYTLRNSPIAIRPKLLRTRIVHQYRTP